MPPSATLVEATDANATFDINNTEILTYTLGGRDADKFRFEASAPTDGQIDGEVPGPSWTTTKSRKSYTVTVTATDPSRDTASIRHNHQPHAM